MLIGCGPLLWESLATVRARGIPLVVIEGDAGAAVPSVRLNDREAERQVATHLRSLGHTRVSVVTLPRDSGRIPGWIETGKGDGPGLAPTTNRLQGLGTYTQ